MTFDENRLLSTAYADLGQCSLIWHFADGVLTWGADAPAVLGLAADQVPVAASGLKTLINPQDLPNLMTSLQDRAAGLDEAQQGGVLVSEPFHLRTRDGTQRRMRLEGRMAIDDKTGAPVLCGVVMQDDDAGNRGFSGVLAGRMAMVDAVESLLLSRSAAVRNRGYFMALGLDRVGLLNAAHGASFVDTVLVEVEHRLSHFLEGKGRVGRMAGDIYGLIFDDLPHTQADALATAMLQMFTSTPVMTLYGPVMIGLSIGGAALISGDEKGSDVVARAEAALAEAKSKGRGCFVVSSPFNEKRERARKLLDGGHAVYRALEQGRMRMAFQPVMDMKAGRMAFYECLIRMVNEDGKLAVADSFIPSLEELGMIRLLDIFSLHTAVRELANYPDINLSVNVSNHSLVDPAWLRAAVSLLMNRRDVASRLIVEITESSAMHDVEAVVRIVRTLKDMGCRIALDDFGAGQTSFMQLKMLQIDVVKIDKAYIRDIQDPMNKLFVHSLLTLAHGMDIRTVAQGAETREEAEMLGACGVDQVQGYGIGYPSIERVWLPKNHDQRIQKTA